MLAAKAQAEAQNAALEAAAAERERTFEAAKAAMERQQVRPWGRGALGLALSVRAGEVCAPVLMLGGVRPTYTCTCTCALRSTGAHVLMASSWQVDGPTLDP